MPLNIWRFHVKKSHEDAFVRMNTVDWPELFGRSPDYQGTAIGRDVNTPDVYLTMDKWASREAFGRFLKEHKSDYDVLDSRQKEHYKSAEYMGFYDML